MNIIPTWFEPRRPLTSRTTLAAMALGVGCVTASATGSLQMTVNTTPGAGLSEYIAFDPLAGDGRTTNTVRIDSFARTSTLGTSTTAGSFSGTLATSLTLPASGFFNELLQPLVLPEPTVATLLVAAALPLLALATSRRCR